MRIGVHLAVHEDHVQVGAHDGFRQRPEVLFGPAQPADLGDLDAVGQVHGQHALAGVIPNRLRHDDLGIFRKVGPEADEVVGLDAIVEFGQQRLAELMHPVGETHAAADVGPAIRLAGDRGHGIEVGDDGLEHARALHLDRDRPSIPQARAVHLRQRGRAERLRVEFGKGLRQLHAERVLDKRAHFVGRQRGDVVLHALQRGQVLRRHHVGACGQRLPHLDEGRAQRLQVVHEGFRPGVCPSLRQRRVANVTVQAGEHAGAAVLQQEAEDLRGARQSAGRFDLRRRRVLVGGWLELRIVLGWLRIWHGTSVLWSMCARATGTACPASLRQPTCRLRDVVRRSGSACAAPQARGVGTHPA